MEYSSINPSFGVELANGTQLVNFNDDDVTALKQLAAERGIVVARNQDMDMQAQAEFGHRLGTPMTTPVNNPGIPEELIVIKAGPKSKAVAGQQWHSDVSSEPVPPGLSMLRMEVVPSSGGTRSLQTCTRLLRRSRVQWAPNTVVFWDNRIVQHHAAFDYHPEVRRGYRVTVVGDAPYLAELTD
jgi:alpha-ketoglutarate-dependent taurine dioxygenase